MNEKELNNWDLWGIEWRNAFSFFNTKGNIHTKSKLKDKWNKSFENILNNIFQKGKLEQKKEELKFLDTIDCGNIDCKVVMCINIKKRIKKLQKEIGGNSK